MSVESTAPSNARTIYALLITLGVIAAIASAVIIGVIVYNYTTRPELRNPPPPPAQAGANSQASLPAWVVYG